MLIINPVEEKQQQAEYCHLCGIPYHMRDFAYAAYVDGEFVGISQFYVTDECGFLEHLAPAPDKRDIEALFIIGRQTLNWIDLLGLHTCRTTPDSSNPKLLSVLGFIAKDGYLEADMTHMFDGHCGGNCDIASQLAQI
jgi:hypothetical protein